MNSHVLQSIAFAQSKLINCC